MKRWIAGLLMATVMMSSISGCGTDNSGSQAGTTSEVQNMQPIEKQEFLLDTLVSIKIYDKKEESLLDNAMDVIRQYNDKLSAYVKGSDIDRINHAGTAWTEVSDYTVECLKKAVEYAEKTGGKFDPTIGAVSMLWDFTDPHSQIPSKESIENGLKAVDYKKMVIEGRKVRFLQEGMKLDLGAIAKGFIADKVKKYLQMEGVKSAIINLGGNVLCVGKKGDRPFEIGVQDPVRERNAIVGIAKVDDVSMVTSGIYERYVEHDGKKYHHILDAKTGYPCEDGLSQVTIYSSDSTDGDALSTSCFLLGLDEGMKLIESMPGVEAVFFTKDGKPVYSSGFRERTQWIEEGGTAK